MSAPADKKALDKLQAAIDKNLEAGDWLYTTLPGSTVPIPTDESLLTEDILKQIGDVSLRSKRRE